MPQPTCVQMLYTPLSPVSRTDPIGVAMAPKNYAHDESPLVLTGIQAGVVLEGLPHDRGNASFVLDLRMPPGRIHTCIRSPIMSINIVRNGFIEADQEVSMEKTLRASWAKLWFRSSRLATGGQERTSPSARSPTRIRPSIP